MADTRNTSFSAIWRYRAAIWVRSAPSSGFYAPCSSHPDLKSFKRLLTAHTSFHSWLTFTLPRRLKRRKPRCSLMCPTTGSTIALRLLYTACPASVRNLRWLVSFGDASAGGGSLLHVYAVLSCFSRPAATYRSTYFTDSSVTCGSLK